MAKLYECFLNLFGSLFAIAAVTVCVIGGYALTLRHHLVVLDAHKYGIICGITLVATGFVFLIVASTVFHETFTKRQGCICTLLAFFSISATIVISLIATAGLTVVLPIKVDFSLKTTIYNNYNKYGEDPKITADIDSLQRMFHCCGIEIYSDWIFKLHYRNLPMSCCVNDTMCTNRKHITDEQVYQTGCGIYLHEFFYSHFIYMVGGAVTLITIFLLCFMVACILMRLRMDRNRNS